MPTSDYDKSRNIIFSYKYFNCKSLKNSIFNNCFKNLTDYAEWITFYLDRISNLSTMSIAEIGSGGKGTRFHPVEDYILIKLKKILKCVNTDTDTLISQNESQNYYELSFGTGKGRIFGYLIGNIYFIFLLDLNHLLYITSTLDAHI